MQLIKRIINRAADLLFVSSLVPFWKRRLSGKTMIYLYHRIGEEGDHDFLDKGGSPITSLEEIEIDIKFLKNLGANFVRVSDLNADILNSKNNNDDFNVVISFDDGFKSNYGVILDYLDEQAVPSTIFQVTSMIESNVLIWEHQLYLIGTQEETKEAFWTAIQATDSSIEIGDFSAVRIKISAEKVVDIVSEIVRDYPELERSLLSLAEELYPSVAEVEQAKKRGHEIGSHGHNHYFRSSTTDEQFEADFLESKKQLTSIGCPAQSFSFPFNQYREGDSDLAAKHFAYIATVNSGSVEHLNQATLLPRNTWPGKPKNELRRRRWLLTGRI